MANDGFHPVPDKKVYTMVVQPHGKVVVGGDFTILGALPRMRIGRLSNDRGVQQKLKVGEYGRSIQWTR